MNHLEMFKPTQSTTQPTGVAEVDELLGQQVGEQLHDEQQVLVLVLLGRGVVPLPANVVLGVDLEQRQACLV